MIEKMKTIFDLIMRINAETEFAAFFSFRGHVNLLSVSVGKDKVNLYNLKVYEDGFYYDNNSEDAYRHVQSIINRLEQFMEVQ